MAGCNSERIHNKDKKGIDVEKLSSRLIQFTDSIKAEIGVAVILPDNDTILINNENKYPMMSVFKLHQAIATISRLEKDGVHLDSIVTLKRSDLDNITWSPMLNEYHGDTISLSVGRLIRYSLEESDNNASNYLFANVLSTQKVDSIIGEIIPEECFDIRYSEAEMSVNHKLAYSNTSSPLGAAMLIDALYGGRCGVSDDGTDFILRSLEQCKTGYDRLAKPIHNKEGVRLGHKTGSGYRDNGILTAHNDIGYVIMPDGYHYIAVVFIKDFDGSEAEASEIIAEISKIIFEML